MTSTTLAVTALFVGFLAGLPVGLALAQPPQTGDHAARGPASSPSVPPAPPHPPAASPGTSDPPAQRAARTQTRTDRVLGVLDVTAYCPTGHRTASGVWPKVGQVATLNRHIPFGTLLRIDGLGTFTVTDRIGHGSDVDIYMGGPDCRRRALTFGRRHLPVTVVRWGR